MGKHEAPSINTKPSAGKKAPPKHAAPGSESKRFPLDLPELKIPEKLKNIELPKLKLPKLPNFKDLPKPKLPAFLRREEDDDEYEDEYEDEIDDDLDDELDDEPELEDQIAFPKKKAAPAPSDEKAEEFRIWRDKPEESSDAPLILPDEEPTEDTPDKFADSSAASDEAVGEEAENIAEEEQEEAPSEKPARVRKPFKLPKIDLTPVRYFFEDVASFGLREDSESHQRVYSFGRNNVLLTAGAALLFFLLWLIPSTGWVRFVLYLIPFLVLGAFTILDAIGEILDRKFPGRNLLITVAAVGLICLGEPHTAVFVMLIHRLFILLECFLFERKEAAIERVKGLLPTAAVAETENGLERREPKDMAAGDTLFVPAGEIVAADGVVIEGISSLDCSEMCGTAATLDVAVNSPVYAGCRNVTNPIKVRVTTPYAESTVVRFTDRVLASLEAEPLNAGFLHKVLGWLPVVLAAAGLIVAILASLITGEWKTWIYRGLLLIALGGCGDVLLSARAVYGNGITAALKKGISYLGTDSVDNFSAADMMIFSKTGTITEGKFTVAAVYPVDYEEKDLLTIAALAECQSTHPIAQALREACGMEMHHRSDITLLEETPGRGIHTLFGGRNIYVGNSSLLLDHNIVFDIPSHKGTIIHVAIDNKYAGCIVLNDKIRDGAFDAIEELRVCGIRAAVMLTGDVRSMARPIASALNFDMVKCELANEAKLESLNYLRESKGNAAPIAYVSSKDEDVELLKEAEVGVAFAALSEHRLISEAPVLLMGNKIYMIPQSMHMAKRISLAAKISGYGMIAAELILLLLGVLGFVSIWVVLLILLLLRCGALAYSLLAR